jgi:drug/metabolite transporter (DMT)-like permease
MDRIEMRGRDAALGIAAALATALIAVGWQVTTRLGATTGLSPLDLALFRYAVPGVLLLPIWWRTGLLPKGLRPPLLALIVLGAGLPFGLAAMAGAQFAPVAHMGALLPGAMPLFVAVAAALVLGERFSGARILGFALIIGGIATIGSKTLTGLDSSTFRGDLLFVGAAMLWAIYTIAYRRSNLSPWQCAAVVNAWSMFGIVPLWAWSGASRIAAAPLADIVTQIIWQGVLAGVLGLWTFAFAVQRIGASRAALSGALVPVLSALAGFVFLGEAPGPYVLLGAAITAAGLVLSAGVMDRRG